jgi:hypothetical protein
MISRRGAETLRRTKKVFLCVSAPLREKKSQKQVVAIVGGE